MKPHALIAIQREVYRSVAVDRQCATKNARSEERAWRLLCGRAWLELADDPQHDIDDRLDFSDEPSAKSRNDELLEKIRKASLKDMTPLEAMNQIAVWQDELI